MLLVKCKWIVFFAIFYLAFGKDNKLWANMSITSLQDYYKITLRESICDSRKMEELDECWSTLPQSSNDGIPTDSQSMDNICSIFNAGMQCVENWKKTCLQTEDQRKVEASVVGAVQTYRVLCSNTSYRAKFLQHAHCYSRISHHWDDCTRRFFNTLAKVDHARDVLSLCCIRLRYLQCVKKVAYSYCTTSASKFLEELANLLMQSTLKTYHSSRCNNINQDSCTSSPAFSVMLCNNASWVLIAVYLTFGFAYLVQK